MDLSWYGGTHPYGYSVLAPALMAVVGVRLCGLLAAVAGAVLLGRLLKDGDRPLLSAVAAGVFCVADVVSGRTTFALGAVAALAALALLPRRRWAAVAAVLTGLLSPVAAAFLGLAALVLVLHRRPGGWSVGVATTVPVVAANVLFPGRGVQPFSADLALPALGVALVVAVMTSSPLVRTGALLSGLVTAVLAMTDDPFGSNVVRLGLVVALPVLLATTRRSGPVVLAVSLGLLAWQLDPTRDDVAASAGPPLKALVSELTSVQAQRVEVVAARDHRDAFEVARAVPLARGWSRQLDVAANDLFYEGDLTPERYVGWLHAHAVDHVAVPRHGALDFGSAREAGLLAKPVAGLVEVWSDRDWRVLSVTDPQPIADTTVVSSGRTRLVLRADHAGDVRVRVRWSRWLSLTGPGCLEEDGSEVRVRFTAPGTVTLGSGLRPRGHC